MLKIDAFKVIPHYTALSYTPYRSPKIFILLSDIAHFAVRLSPFQGAIWCISAPETGHFACRNGAFRNTFKSPLNINY